MDNGYQGSKGPENSLHRIAFQGPVGQSLDEHGEKTDAETDVGRKQIGVGIADF